MTPAARPRLCCSLSSQGAGGLGGGKGAARCLPEGLAPEAGLPEPLGKRLGGHPVLAIIPSSLAKGRGHSISPGPEQEPVRGQRKDCSLVQSPGHPGPASGRILGSTTDMKSSVSASRSTQEMLCVAARRRGARAAQNSGRGRDTSPGPCQG